MAHNALLSGDNFRNDDPVTVNPTAGLVGVEVGITHRIGKFFEFMYSQTYQTAEFRHQRGADPFGSVQLAFFVAW